MSLIEKSKKKKITNIIIILCFLITAGCFVVDGNITGGLVTGAVGIIFLGLYKFFEK
ncbi:hypothetical protein [uncultured Clostridium sp.]|jgi:hypothetical protein|uniref:hypothetical protein n=1 Tax=uncultured Clostridium sp. TaxID=59620 RepID=UPI0026248C01|nr:hypothetical protein [uncultured Clostridium sp.]